jgi:hypothetical protein
MAGLWGAKNANYRDKLRSLSDAMFKSLPRHYWDFDQALLRRIIWPEAVKDSLQHDSYSCQFDKFNSIHLVQPFPTRRQDKLYVGWGAVKGSPDKTGIKPCPKKCRFSPQWTFC